MRWDKVRKSCIKREGRNEFPFLLWLCVCHHHHHHHHPPHQISCLYLGTGRRAGKWCLVFAPILLNDLTFPTCRAVAHRLLLFYTDSDDKPVCTLCSRANQWNDTFILSCWADWPLKHVEAFSFFALFLFSFFFNALSLTLDDVHVPAVRFSRSVFRLMWCFDITASEVCQPSSCDGDSLRWAHSTFLACY